MAVIKITIPNGVVKDVENSFADRYGYQDTLPGGGANPEDKSAFMRRMLNEHIKEVHRFSKVKTFGEGGQAVADQADSDLSGLKVEANAVGTPIGGGL